MCKALLLLLKCIRCVCTTFETHTLYKTCVGKRSYVVTQLPQMPQPVMFELPKDLYTKHLFGQIIGL